MRNSFSLVIAALFLAACGGGSEQTGSTTSTGSGGSGGSGGSTTSSTGSGMAQPITAPDETWTWVPIDGTFCADGSPTGIAVNLTKKSSRVLVYLEGGGACWDELTCYTLMTAANFSGGYGQTQFDGDKSELSASFFDRTDAQNPLKDYSFVYVPYCTGDIHAGNNVATYGTHMAHHVGFANMTADLARIVPTFPNADRVILAGSSAGGFGATYNWWQAQQAFGSIRVDLIDDSGTVMPPDIPVQYQAEELASWKLASTLPPGCTGCDMHLDGLIGFYASKFADHRAALLSYTQDSVLPTFFGISTDQFTMGLDELTTKELDPSANFRYFTVNASGHVLWFDPTLATNGTTLQTFVTDMVTDAKDWNSVHP